MKPKVNIFCYTASQVIIYGFIVRTPKPGKVYEITPLIFHCKSSEEILLLTKD
jgi:hypothetical protein